MTWRRDDKVTRRRKGGIGTRKMVEGGGEKGASAHTIQIDFSAASVYLERETIFGCECVIRLLEPSAKAGYVDVGFSSARNG